MELNNTSFMLTNSISAQRLVFVLYFIYDNAQASGGSSIHHPCHLCSVMVCSRSVCDLHSMLAVAFTPTGLRDSEGGLLCDSLKRLF